MEVNHTNIKIENDVNKRNNDEMETFLTKNNKINNDDDDETSQNGFFDRLFKTNKSKKNRVEIVDHETKNDHVQTEERLQWSSFWEYFLSIIGFVIDLGKFIYLIKNTLMFSLNFYF